MNVFIKHLALTVFLACATLGARAEHHWDEVTYNTVPLGEGIYALIAEGGNIAVAIGDDGTFLIDDQFAPLTRKLLGQIETLGGGIPRFLINTHWHYDHTGANENLGADGTLIVAHDNVRKRLAVDNRIEPLGVEAPALSREGLPVVTFSRDTSFHINGETIRALHVAHAHTDGDAIVHFEKANVIHAGDVWFNGFYPFIDIAHGGSLAGTIAAVDRILDLADDNTRIVPGHGPVGNRQQLTEYREMLSQIKSRLSELKQQGKSLQEVIAIAPTKSLDEEWGDGFLSPEKWLKIIYDGLEMP